MKRRGFLQALGIALAAPAIVKAENLMKIVVPKKEIIVPVTDLITGFGDGEFTAEMWTKPLGEGWNHLAITRSNGRVFHYVNGVLTSPEQLKAKGWQMLDQQADKRVIIDTFDNKFVGMIDDLRVTQNVARDIPKSPQREDWHHFEVKRSQSLQIDPPKRQLKFGERSLAFS